MAVLHSIPSLHVTIEAEGKALQEFDYDATNDGYANWTSKVARYVEAPSEAWFTIRFLYKPPFDPPFALHMEIMLDGVYVHVPCLEYAGDGACEGYKCQRLESSVSLISRRVSGHVHLLNHV
jgi:hypothetical protein